MASSSSRTKKRTSEGEVSLEKTVTFEAPSETPTVNLNVVEFVSLVERFVSTTVFQLGFIKAGFLLGMGIVLLNIGAFTVLTPMTYHLGGLYLYGNQGWAFFQPGKGGIRFIAIQTFVWLTYSITIVLSFTNVYFNDISLSFGAFSFGLMSYALTLSSLMVYHHGEATTRNAVRQIEAPSDKELKSQVFSFETSILAYNGDTPSDLWWVFVFFNTVLSVSALLAAMVAENNVQKVESKLLINLVVLWVPAITVTLTHAIGGQWKHHGYLPLMMFKGGATFIVLQIAGWTLLGVTEAVGLALFFTNLQTVMEIPNVSAQIARDVLGLVPTTWHRNQVIGGLGVASHTIIATSLFFFQRSELDGKLVGGSNTRLLDFMRYTHFLGLNIFFSQGSSLATSREVKIKSVNDWEEGEKRFKQTLENAKGNEPTGDQYLIIGVGFVGKRLVQRLLSRGETKIRLFDITPVNPFDGNPHVEYVRGDVTKYEQILSAMQGVNTCYSIFAIIRFMDRLEHQAALSYRINVGGTENVLKAAKACNVERMIVTSSSNATTDEHSLPRFDRDETAPYVTRDTAHNHYGWSKAAADIMCLQADGSKTANGKTLTVGIIRPCSGVFGGDDRHLMEKALDLFIFPGIGAKALVDLVYVENVVLGHLLLEAAFQNKGKVFGLHCNGQAFNVSNNEPMKNEEFWFSVMKIIKLCDPAKVKSSLDLVFLPMAPLWLIAYISELNQYIFRGKVSLGHDIDMMSPGMMTTALMAYTYTSKKAEKYLGYQPAYTVDEAIQKSLYDYWAIKYSNSNSNKKKKHI